jgi:hypothetical protein
LHGKLGNHFEEDGGGSSIVDPGDELFFGDGEKHLQHHDSIENRRKVDAGLAGVAEDFYADTNGLRMCTGRLLTDVVYVFKSSGSTGGTGSPGWPKKLGGSFMGFHFMRGRVRF